MNTFKKYFPIKSRNKSRLWFIELFKLFVLVTEYLGHVLDHGKVAKVGFYFTFYAFYASYSLRHIIP